MEDEKVGTEVTTTETGTTEVTENKKTLIELINSDKDYQSQFDKEKSNSIKTAIANERKKWEQEQQTKLAEAEKLAKMDADEKRNYEMEQLRKELADEKKKNQVNALQSETMKLASEKGIPLEYLNTLNFEYETAETIKVKLDIFEKTTKSISEKAISEYSKEPAPKVGDRHYEKDISELKSYEEFVEYYKKHPEAK